MFLIAFFQHFARDDSAVRENERAENATEPFRVSTTYIIIIIVVW